MLGPWVVADTDTRSHRGGACERPSDFCTRQGEAMRRAMGLAAAAFAALTLWSGNALAGTTFHPRVGGALGLVPSYANTDIATGAPTAVDYNGGAVMAPNVTVHTIFWAPSGYSFTAGYEALVKQFLTDAAAASGTTSNVFSVLRAVRAADRHRDRRAGELLDRLRRDERLDRRRPPLSVLRRLRVTQRRADLPHRRPGPGRDRRGRAGERARPGQPLVRAAAGRRRRMHHRRLLRHQQLRRLPRGHGPRPRRDDLRRDHRPDRRVRAPAGRRSRGQSRRGGDDRHRRPRDRRGDHRSRGHRLGGPQRLRGRRQVRGGPADRDPARLRRRTARPTTS